MRLLICTQKVDKEDSVLGFFHSWICSFAERFEHITVICLEKGVCDVPLNVSVYSLGKEEGVGRVRYVARFFTYIWRFRKEYDAVFVHMNQEYVLLGGVLWRLWGKRTAMWYNHTVGTFKTRLSALIVHRLFHTSPYAFTAQFRNAVRMPAGIDTALFYPRESIERKENSVLFVGRISPIKGVHTLVEAVQKVYEGGEKEVLLDVYGDALPEDAEYYKETQALDRNAITTFHSAVPNYETPEIYSGSEIFVNLTPRGNYDKTILEAMACGAIPVVASDAFADIIPDELRPERDDRESVAGCLRYALTLEQDKKGTLKEVFKKYVNEHHSLEQLRESLKREYLEI